MNYDYSQEDQGHIFENSSGLKMVTLTNMEYLGDIHSAMDEVQANAD